MDVKKRRVKLKQINYALRSVSVVLQCYPKGGDSFEHFCAIGTATPKEYGEWFVDDVGVGSKFVVCKEIDVLYISISEG